MGLPTLIPPKKFGHAAGAQGRSVYDARMSSAEKPPPSDTDDKLPAPAQDDTAAFQAYYRGASEPARGLLYRVFVSWWRDRG